MEKEIRNQGYTSIRSMKDLQYQRRLLTSRIDHQEIMVQYKLRNLWDYLSPARLITMGCEAVAAHNSTFNLVYRTIGFVKSFISSRRG